MTPAEIKYMDAKFKEQGNLIRELTHVVTPLVAKVAVVEDRQREQPKKNKLYTTIGICIGLIISLATIVVTLLSITPK